MKINVTQKHIDQGIRSYAGECPIALSVREVKPKTYVSVTSNYIFVGNKLITLPPTARNFIYRFDGGRKVKPFEFELPIRKQAQR